MYQGCSAERPELVRNEIRATLPDNPASLSQAIINGERSFEAAGGARAYFGYPANVTAEEGYPTVDILGTVLCEAVLEVVDISNHAPDRNT